MRNVTRVLGLLATALAALALVLAAGTSAAAKRPSVEVTPHEISSGERIVVRGKHFKPDANVKLLIGPPRSEGVPIASAHTDARGRFRKAISFDGEGRWVLLACRRDCAVKATDRFVVR
jgi:hypothetical protein